MSATKTKPMGMPVIRDTSGVLPLAWFDLCGPRRDQGGGDVADLRGRVAAGTRSGTCVFGPTSGGTGLVFGSAQAGRVDVPLTAKPPTLTVSAVVTFSSLPTYGLIAGTVANTAWTDGWGLVQLASTVRFFVGNYVGSGQANAAVAAGVRYSIVCTYDGAALRLYLNGSLAASKAYSTSINYVTSRLWVGSDAANEGIIGSISDLQIHSYASPASYAAAYSADPWWRLRPHGPRVFLFGSAYRGGAALLAAC